MYFCGALGCGGYCCGGALGCGGCGGALGCGGCGGGPGCAGWDGGLDCGGWGEADKSFCVETCVVFVSDLEDARVLAGFRLARVVTTLGWKIKKEQFKTYLYTLYCNTHYTAKTNWLF